eukprot:gb/GECH01010220.1/.p1 GENE.gb/GECH01010220.1/~~gb/GECH01010220.1/.p1  ORF type:complete len:300 (+),score=65.38 gb/GECH01010220.1/:1-900(+)
MTYWRINELGQIDDVMSLGLKSGGVQIRESSTYDSFIHTAHTDPVLRLWTLNKFTQPIKRYTFHTMEVEDLSISPFDGEEFLSCSKDSSFALWNIADSEPLFAATNESKTPMISVMHHNQNPELFFAAPLDGRVELWNHQERKKVYTITPPDDIMFASMDINKYNEYMLSIADENGYVYLWDLRMLKKPVSHWQAHSLAVAQVKFNPHDENIMATTSTDTFTHIWYIDDNGTNSDSQNESNSMNQNSNSNQNHQCLKSYQTHSLPVTAMDWSVHEMGLLCDGGSDYSIFVWNMIDEEET